MNLSTKSATFWANKPLQLHGFTGGTASTAKKWLVKQRMLDFPLLQNHIHADRHGYLKFRWTSTCHCEFFNFVSVTAGALKSLSVTYLDMTKAFDRVSQFPLLFRPVSCGVLSAILWMFKSYCYGFHPEDSVGDKFLHAIPVTSSIIQGNVLNPYGPNCPVGPVYFP